MIFSMKDGKLQIGGHDVNTDPMNEAAREGHTPDPLHDNESIKNLNQDHGSPEEYLRALLDIPYETRDPAWEYSFFKTIPSASFKANGVYKVSDEEYIVAVLCSNNLEGEEKVSFAQIINYAFNTQRGMAVLKHEDYEAGPDATIRYGAVWAYHEYGHLGGTPNTIAEYEHAFSLRPDSPFDAIEKDSDRITVGTPSKAYFPLYVRDLMTEAIKKDFPDAQPNFQLLNQERYAAPHSILLSLGFDCSEQEQRELQSKLLWFIPPYLPLALD